MFLYRGHQIWISRCLVRVLKIVWNNLHSGLRWPKYGLQIHLLFRISTIQHSYLLLLRSTSQNRICNQRATILRRINHFAIEIFPILQVYRSHKIQYKWTSCCTVQNLCHVWNRFPNDLHRCDYCTASPRFHVVYRWQFNHSRLLLCTSSTSDCRPFWVFRYQWVQIWVCIVWNSWRVSRRWSFLVEVARWLSRWVDHRWYRWRRWRCVMSRCLLRILVILLPYNSGNPIYCITWALISLFFR